MQPTSLKAGRRRLGSAIGLIVISTTSGASTATDSLTIADLIDSEAETSLYARSYAMPTSTGSTNAGQVARVRKDGFTAATGVLRTVKPYTGVTSSGVEIEIYAPLPPKDADSRIGLHTCINRALAESWDIDRLAITPTSAAQSTFSLFSAADWIRSDEQIVDVWFRRSGSTYDELVPEWQYVSDVNAGQLEIRGVALSTTDTLKPEVYRPLNRWIEVNSTWGESTTGMVNDSDRCLLNEDGIEAIGKAHALATLATMGDIDGKRIDKADALQARRDADHWKHTNLPRKWGRPVHWTRGKTVTGGALWPREGSLG